MKRALVVILSIAVSGCYVHSTIPASGLGSAVASCAISVPYSDFEVTEKTQVKIGGDWKRFCEQESADLGRASVEIRNYDEWLTLAAILAVSGVVALVFIGFAASLQFTARI